ncbi:MAG TPA: fumarylacetoacetate hydrolase family protein [Chitinophagaceae bacterium]|nr:fumarylacetoacetate hydrolase family protein [Chitinophagaceae bacterium]
MKIYHTGSGILIQHEGQYFRSAKGLTDLINRDGLYHALLRELVYLPVVEDAGHILEKELLPPIDRQEIWAAGVTYFRSMEARMDESRESGAAVFYDQVYGAVRPELFFKSTAGRVAGNLEQVNIRADSSWNVPEPELTLYINSRGKITAYTIGNDMSSRSIEGENPLYLPQAKIYERSAALGPCLLVLPSPLDPDTQIQMEILRAGKSIFRESVSLGRMKRSLAELADWLFRGCHFPEGCYLMTGTCLVPGDGFTLLQDDIVRITIEAIGTLVNRVGILGIPNVK